MKGCTINQPHIERLKAKWPCHGLPEGIKRIWVEFDASNNLVDYQAFWRNGRPVKQEAMAAADASGALGALIDDARRAFVSAQQPHQFYDEHGNWVD